VLYAVQRPSQPEAEATDGGGTQADCYFL